MPTVIEVVAVLVFLAVAYVLGIGLEAVMNRALFAWRGRHASTGRSEAQMLADAIAVKRHLDEQAFRVHQQLSDHARHHQAAPQPRSRQRGR